MVLLVTALFAALAASAAPGWVLGAVGFALGAVFVHRAGPSWAPVTAQTTPPDIEWRFVLVLYLAVQCGLCALGLAACLQDRAWWAAGASGLVLVAVSSLLRWVDAPV